MVARCHLAAERASAKIAAHDASFRALARSGLTVAADYEASRAATHEKALRSMARVTGA